jgi:hypothetical protein
MSDQWIVSAACRVEFLFEDQVTVMVLCSPRHWDTTFRTALEMIQEDKHKPTSMTQGFIDQFGNFLTREEAWVIAEKNGQIRFRCGGDEFLRDGKIINKLFSENLY